MAKYERARWVDNSDGTMSLKTARGKGLVIPLSNGTFKVFIHDYTKSVNPMSWHTRTLERNAKTLVRDAIKVEVESPDVSEMLKKYATLSRSEQDQFNSMMPSLYKRNEKYPDMYPDDEVEETDEEEK